MDTANIVDAQSLFDRLPRYIRDKILGFLKQFLSLEISMSVKS